MEKITSPIKDASSEEIIIPEALTKEQLKHIFSELICPICHDYLCEPISFLCGHSFCKECIHLLNEHSKQQSNGSINLSDFLGNKNKKRCPVCNENLDLKTTTIKENFPLTNIIYTLIPSLRLKKEAETAKANKLKDFQKKYSQSERRWKIMDTIFVSLQSVDYFIHKSRFFKQVGDQLLDFQINPQEFFACLEEFINGKFFKRRGLYNGEKTNSPLNIRSMIEGVNQGGTPSMNDLLSIGRSFLANSGININTLFSGDGSFNTNEISSLSRAFAESIVNGISSTTEERKNFSIINSFIVQREKINNINLENLLQDSSRLKEDLITRIWDYLKNEPNKEWLTIILETHFSITEEESHFSKKYKDSQMIDENVMNYLESIGQLDLPPYCIKEEEEKEQEKKEEESKKVTTIVPEDFD